MLNFVFILLNFILSAKVTIILSGNLTLQNPCLNGEETTFKFQSNAQAMLTFNRSIFSVIGGTAAIFGNDNDIKIGQDYCVEGIACSDPNIFLIYVASSAIFSVRDCSFKGLDNFTSVVHVDSAERVEIEECEASGTLFMFAKISNAADVTIRQCVFKNIRQESSSPYVFYGFMLTLVNCSQLTLRECDFNGVHAGQFDEEVQYSVNKTIGGFAAPVFIQGGQEATIRECSFTSCSGFLSGAVVTYKPGSQQTFRELKFTGNSYMLPLDNLSAILGAIPDADELFDSLEGFMSLGNDLTRIGDPAVEVREICSGSGKPHFRDGLYAVSFEPCAKAPVAEIAGVVVACVVAAASVVVLLLCCGCCCACCYKGRCGRYCYRRRGYMKAPEDCELQNNSSTNTDGVGMEEDNTAMPLYAPAQTEDASEEEDEQAQQVCGQGFSKQARETVEEYPLDDDGSV